jgi:hypothetical protein
MGEINKSILRLIIVLKDRDDVGFNVIANEGFVLYSSDPEQCKYL